MRLSKKTGKGWSRARQFTSRKLAEKYAKWLKPKFNRVIIQKGTHTYGIGIIQRNGSVKGIKKQTVYRVWVK